MAAKRERQRTAHHNEQLQHASIVAGVGEFDGLPRAGRLLARLTVVFSGDDRRSENLIAKAQQVDVLFHPMSGFTPQELSEPSRIGERRRASLEFPASLEDAAAVFNRSRCKVTILIHTSRDEQSLGRGRAAYGGRLEVADDLTEVLVGEDVVVKPIKP